MTLLSIIVLASIFSISAYYIMSARYSEVLIGLALFSNGINLLLIDSSQPLANGIDPLPQALILTAIVIGFGLLAFIAAFMIVNMQKNKTDTITPIKEET